MTADLSTAAPFDLSTLPDAHAAFLAGNLAAIEHRYSVRPAWTADDLRRVRVEPTGGAGSAWTASVETASGWARYHSARKPLEEATAVVRRAFGSEPAPLALSVFGAGLGYLLDVLEAGDPRTRFLVLEPLAGLVPWFLARRDWRPLIDRGRLLVLAAPDFDGRSEAWRLVEPREGGSRMVVNPTAARIMPEAASAAARVLAGAISGAVQNEDARRRFSGPYLLNTIRNLPVVSRARPVSDWFGAQEGMPAIVAAAGPSLDFNKREMLDVRDRAVVIAADTALRPLLLEGVEPDFVVAVDPGEVNARTLSEIPDCPRTRLIAEGSLSPRSFERFDGRTWLFRVAAHEPWPWLLGHGIDPGMLHAWGSVLVTAFDFAVRLGCDPIVIVGADLAYSREQPYCRDTIYEPDWQRQVEAGTPLSRVWRERTANATLVVDDVNGDRVRTTAALVAFRDAVVQAAARLNGRRVVNATGAGILAGRGIAQGRVSELAASPSRPIVTDRSPGGTRSPVPALVTRVLEDACRNEGLPWQAHDANGVELPLLPHLVASAEKMAGLGDPLPAALDELHRRSNQRLYESGPAGRSLFSTAADEFRRLIEHGGDPVTVGRACDALNRWAFFTAGVEPEAEAASNEFVGYCREWSRAAALREAGTRDPGVLNVGYLGAWSTFDLANQLAWFTWSVLKGHADAASRDLRVHYYAIDAPTRSFADALARLGIEVHEPCVGASPVTTLHRVRAAVAADQIEVLVSTARTALSASLFAARSATLQVFLDYGIPWYAVAADACFDVGRGGPPPYDVERARAMLSQELRDRRIRPRESFVIGYVGRLARLSASDLGHIASAVAARPGAEFRACGAGDGAAIEAAFERSGLGDRLVLDNRQPDFARVLGEADVAVAPTGFGEDALHAVFAAAGVPVVESQGLAAIVEGAGAGGNRKSLKPLDQRFVRRRQPGVFAPRLENWIRDRWAERQGREAATT